MKTLILGLVGAFALTAATTVSAQVVYDANPQVPFTYGTGNDYTPANAAVLTSNVRDGGYEIAGRAHVPGQPASATGGTGIYTFNIGQNVSIDFSFFGAAINNALVTITNVGNGADASFAAALLGTVQTNGALQGSQQLGFGFLNGSIDPSQDIDFTNATDSTYRIDLTGAGQSVTYFAQIGAGAGAGAVPEPATWAMMLIGFGAMGVSLRRRRRAQTMLQAA